MAVDSPLRSPSVLDQAMFQGSRKLAGEPIGLEQGGLGGYLGAGKLAAVQIEKLRELDSLKRS